MNEDYFLYCEDVDWCMRVNPNRLRFAPEAIVYHRHGAAIGSNRIRKKRSRLSVYLDERNKLLLSRRFYPALYPVIVIVTLPLLAQYVVQGAFRNAGFALQGWFAGIRGEVGPPKFMAAAAAGGDGDDGDA